MNAARRVQQSRATGRLPRGLCYRFGYVQHARLPVRSSRHAERKVAQWAVIENPHGVVASCDREDLAKSWFANVRLRARPGGQVSHESED